MKTTSILRALAFTTAAALLPSLQATAGLTSDTMSLIAQVKALPQNIFAVQDGVLKLRPDSFTVHEITVSIEGDNLVLRDHNCNFPAAGAGVTLVNPRTASVPLASVTRLMVMLGVQPDRFHASQAVGVPMIIHGNDGNDIIVGGVGIDYLCGGNYDDNISGGGGNDVICGDAGSDHLQGDDGDDTIFGGSIATVVSGGMTYFKSSGSDKADIIRGGDGDDVLIGGDGIDQIAGGNGNDTLTGDAGDDEVFGDDELMGTDGNDIICASLTAVGYTEDACYLLPLQGVAGNDVIHLGLGDEIQ